MLANKRSGFTLVEIMIAAAIIVIILVIAIPGFTRARVVANETAAIGTLYTLIEAQRSYRSVNTAYPGDLRILAGTTPPYIDEQLGSLAGNVIRRGYAFGVIGGVDSFGVRAEPDAYPTTGIRSFFGDQTGLVIGGDYGGAQCPPGAPPVNP